MTVSRRNVVLSAFGLAAAAATTGAVPSYANAAPLSESGGDQRRALQAWLTARYGSRPGFPSLSGTGAAHDRNTMNALVYALQYEVGVPEAEANGVFGPQTRERVAALGEFGQSSTVDHALVRLFQGSLIMYGYALTLDGIFGPATTSACRRAEGIAELEQRGTARLETWAGLLVSTGDLRRATAALDTSTPLTAASASMLAGAGFSTVGRYLSGPGKGYQPGEMDVIAGAGLTTFPIFQEWNNSPEHFSEELGRGQGDFAATRAADLGFAAQTMIYFVVDMDASASFVRDSVVPHFRGIDSALARAGRRYRLGIYGPRAVCTQLGELGLTSSSFVSGMSTGYLGNLGHPLPLDWAYNQIEELTVGSGDAAIGIDRNVMSSRAEPVAPPRS